MGILPQHGQNGDRMADELHEAFLRLFTRAEPELRAFVRSCLPRLQDVDEVMQEVSLVAWRNSVIWMIAAGLPPGPASSPATRSSSIAEPMPAIASCSTNR